MGGNRSSGGTRIPGLMPILEGDVIDQAHRQTASRLATALNQAFPDAEITTWLFDGRFKPDPRFPNSPRRPDVSSWTTIEIRDGGYFVKFTVKQKDPSVVDIPQFVTRERTPGRGSAMWQKIENALQKGGIKEVRLHASADAGPYFWAKQGFRYDSRIEPRRANTLSRWDDGTGISGAGAVKTATSRFKKFVKLNGIPTPSGGWPTFSTPEDFIKALGPENAKRFFSLPVSRGSHGDWTGYKEL